jgi:hypothetical protein
MIWFVILPGIKTMPDADKRQLPVADGFTPFVNPPSWATVWKDWSQV